MGNFRRRATHIQVGRWIPRAATLAVLLAISYGALVGLFDVPPAQWAVCALAPIVTAIIARHVIR